MPDLSCKDLKDWLAERRTFLLVDVSPVEDYEREHIPTAGNACVYEVDFLQQLAALAADRHAPIVVYGSSARSLASKVAAEKLGAAGYGKVHDFRGGLTEWRAAGGRMEGSGRAHESERNPPDGAYAIDANRSVIEWVGRNLGGKHDGTLRLGSGQIHVQAGAANDGHFVIDMTSMANRDIEDRSMRQVLIDHLSSDDFFEVAKYPEARFDLESIEPIPEATPGCPNSVVRGRLTIKNITNSIKFEAVIGMNDNGELVAQANFDFDRTRWNVIYGSGKLFEQLGKHLVNDLVSVELRILAVRMQTP